MDDINTTPKAGFVTLIGRPNTGKSTLMNALLKQKVAAVSPRPQTTQRRQLGILTEENVQIIFMDTPGIHNPQHKLGKYMNDAAQATIQDADVVVWMIDVCDPPQEEDLIIAKLLNEVKHLPATILALNKVDMISEDKLKENQAAFLQLLPSASPLPISATSGKGQQKLLNEIIKQLPEGLPFYDSDQITDLYEREISADLIRAACLNLLEDEIPHSIGVYIDEYKERGETGAFIAATLFVERESHKSIVIGKNGSMIKDIGSAARKEIEKMSGRKIFLDLRVKLKKNWRDDPNSLQFLGFIQK